MFILKNLFNKNLNLYTKDYVNNINNFLIFYKWQ